MLLLAAGTADAQRPPRLSQDALDFLPSRSNVVQGAGARAYGMGGAFLARPDDATAASWNPAGLSYLRSPEFSLVGTYGSLKIVQEDLDGELTGRDSLSGRSPDFLAATYPVSLGGVSGAVQLGYQRVLSFDGNHTIESNARRQFEQFGGFDVVAIGSGLQVSRRARVGATVNRWLNGYRFTSDRLGGRPSRQTTDFSFSGWNVNLGVIWTPVEELNLGAIYKTGFTAEVRLSRRREDFAAPATAGAPLGPPTSVNSYERSDVRLDFPAALGFGASWRPSTPLTVSADYTRTQWSEGRIRNYFTLPPSGTPAPPDDFFPDLPYPSLEPRLSQNDTQQLRLGAEYVIIKRRIKWPLRLGYFTDRQLFETFNPQRDAPPQYRGFTAGTGLIFGRLLVDIAYVFEKGSYLDLNPDDPDPELRLNSVRSHRLFLSLIYRHRR